MAMRHSFQFVLYVARNILLHVLYLIYCVLYKMLEVVETCCWHVDNWREDHITTKGSVRDVSTPHPILAPRVLLVSFIKR